MRRPTFYEGILLFTTVLAAVVAIIALVESNRLNRQAKAMRRDFDLFVLEAATSRDIRTRLDVAENAVRQAQARTAEIAEQLDRAADQSDPAKQ